MQAPPRVNPTKIDPKYQSRVTCEGQVVKVDACDICYRDLNAILRAVIQNDGVEKIEIYNVCGQRYIGTDLSTNVQIHIYGTPGNDLAAFGNGPQITVHGNGQDGSGNTMNEGQIVIEGHAGDVTGHSIEIIE